MHKLINERAGQVRGRLAAARLLVEANELLLHAGSPAIEAGWLALRAIVLCPDWTELVEVLEAQAVPA